MSFRKIKIDQTKPFPLSVLGVTEEDAPTYPLLEFVGFDTRPLSDINTAEVPNYPRKSELIQTKLEGLIASTADYQWLAKAWPLDVYQDADKCETQFERRHTARAMRANNWTSAPVAIWRRKHTGDDVLDNLSDASRLSLMGLYANATDGGNVENAGQKDFFIIGKIMEDEGICRSLENVEKLLRVSGIYQRFPKRTHKGTISTVRNFIMENKKPSPHVFNTSKTETNEWFRLNPRFGKNNVSIVDGVQTRHKILDNDFTYRYACDILKWSFAAFATNETVRVACSSKATCEHEIEQERADIVDTIRDILDSTINWFTAKVEKSFSLLGMSITLPKVTLDDLPLELYWIPQIEGETEAIRVPLT